MEVIRFILEAIYEPRFSEESHGYRVKKNCHTALYRVREQFGMTFWCLKSNLSMCFDNIDHHKLMLYIEKIILDRKFTRLLREGFRAGYLKFRDYQRFINGLYPRLTIISILNNIYLDQLDKFVLSIRFKYTKGVRIRTTSYDKRIDYFNFRKIKKSLINELKKPSGKMTLDFSRGQRYLEFQD